MDRRSKSADEKLCFESLKEAIGSRINQKLPQLKKIKRCGTTITIANVTRLGSRG